MVEKPHNFWKLAAIDVLVMLAWAAAWSAALATSSGSQIAYGFLALLIFLFVSAPAAVVLLAYGITIVLQFGIRKSKWVLSYSLLSLLLHLAIAYESGFFDSWIDEYQRSSYERQNPALANLRYAVGAGPRSNIDNVLEDLTNGADPDSSISRDEYIPLLVVAAARSDTLVVDALLSAGANPNLSSAINFQTLEKPSALDVLLFSEYEGIPESLELLLAAGANPENSMILVGACWLGDIALYRRAQFWHAKNKADLNGNACLHLAAKSNRREFLQTYISDSTDEGSMVAELNSANNFGQYPLDVAITERHIEAALVIAAAGGVANQPARVKRYLDDNPDSSLAAELKALLATE